MQYNKEVLSFKKLYKKSFKRNPIFDFKKFEVYASILASIIITFILYFLYKCNGIENIVSLLQSALFNIAIALLGVLGFIIGGLAIVSGTVNSKIAHEMNRKDKFDSLLSVLFSFYYIGGVIGVLILIFFISYFVVSLELKFILGLYLILGFVLSYGLFFCIFYSVSLLGTCINIFVICYNYSNSERDDLNLDNYFKDVRIDALTSLLVKYTPCIEEEFIDTVNDCIYEDCPDIIKDKLKKMVLEYYNRSSKS